MLEVLHPIYHGFAVLIGLALGSFANVGIARWPDNRSVVPGSACPICSTPIAWYDNIPLLSWGLLRGRCRHCDTPISPLYPSIELLGGLLGWLIYARFIPTPESLTPANGAAAVLFGLMTLFLVIATYVDLRHSIIPDEVTIYAAPVGILGHGVLEALGYDGWLSVGLQQSVLAAAAWGGFFHVFAWVGRFLTRRDVFGQGDVKLITMIAAFFGGWLPLPTLLIGSLLGAIAGFARLAVVWQNRPLPAGPGFTVAAMLILLYGDHIVAWLMPGLTLRM